jgi:hypothetical protein
MPKWWPSSRWNQAAIALFGSAIASVCVFEYANASLFEQAVRYAPRDGQDELAAFMGALEISFWTFIGLCTCLYAIQRFLDKRQDS